MIQTQEVSITYQGDGVQTSFAYPYAYRSNEDIKGYLINEEGYEEKITTNYRYDTVENKYIYPLQGEPLQAPWRIKLIRETPQQQNEKLPNKLPFSMIEKSLDWIIMILQEIGTRMNFLWHIRNDCKQSETNAKNSANAAAKSEENAANSQDMAQKWAMSPTSPDGNIDENSPTGLTQSSKIWAALSREYAGMSKFKMPIAYYNSVAEMKASETALVGRPCVTLGYYAPNEGGGSVYIIRAKAEDDADDGGSIIVLENRNVAELMWNGEVNIKQWGAYGDNEHDDTESIQNAIDYAYIKGRNTDVQVVQAVDGKLLPKIIFPSGVYLISKTISFDRAPCVLKLDMSVATLKYTGSDYAILFRRLRNSQLKLGTIIANSGGGVHFLVRNDVEADWIQYVHTTFTVIQCMGTGVFAECTNVKNESEEQTLQAWMNAMFFYGGRFMNSNNGFHIKSEKLGNIHEWHFINCSSEHSKVGFLLENVSKSDVYSMSGFTLTGCYLNDVDLCSLKTVGRVKNVCCIKSSAYAGSFRISSETKNFQLIPNENNGDTLQKGDDLNEYIYKGTFYIQKNEDVPTILNAPKIGVTEYTDAGMLIVRDFTSPTFNNVPYNILQIYIEYTGKHIFKRFRTITEQQWSPWILINTPVEVLEDMYKKNKTANKLINDGEYISSSFKDIDAVDLPVKEIGRLIVKSVGADGYYVYQTYYTYTGAVYMRMYDRGTNVWKKWKKIVDLNIT